MEACDWLRSSSHGSVMWQGHVGGRAVGPSGPKASMPRPLALYVHICHLFGQTLVYFLHTNNSTSTSGTMWIINKILHMWWWFTSLYHAFGWNVDGQNRCFWPSTVCLFDITCQGVCLPFICCVIFVSYASQLFMWHLCTPTKECIWFVSKHFH